MDSTHSRSDQRMIGLLKRSAANVHNVNTRCCLKLGLVTSNLANASQVWNLQTITLCTELERIKRMATTFIIVRVLFDTEISQRKTRYSKQAGCYWREYIDILFLFKTAPGLIVINADTLPKPVDKANLVMDLRTMNILSLHTTYIRQERYVSQQLCM